MIIAVLSGKGGTGKTTVAASLALAIEKNIQFLDCDVEEPNAHIFLKPKITSREVVSVLIPRVDSKKCDFCGKCSKVCEYNALVVAKDQILLFPNLCHSCGGCILLCPKQAFTEVERNIGEIQFGKSNGIDFITGILNVGEARAVPVISAVKKKINKDKIVIIDASPGTSCPVVEAIKGSDFCLLVSESTPFGLSDLELAVQVVRKMDIPLSVVINKYNSYFTQTEEFCQKNKIPVLLKIPEDRRIAEAYSKGINLIETFPEYKEKLQKMFERIKK